MADGTVHWPTMQEVMERLHPGGRLEYVRTRASKERWTDTRAINQAAQARKRAEARGEEYAEATIRIDNRALRTAETGLAVIHARLAELAEFASRRRSGDVDARAGAREDSREASTLALAAWRFHVVGMRAVGLEGARAGAAQPGALVSSGEVALAGQVERALAARIREHVSAISMERAVDRTEEGYQTPGSGTPRRGLPSIEVSSRDSSPS